MTKEISGNSEVGKVVEPRRNKMETVEDCLELMEHIACCGSVNCNVRGCLRMKKALQHAKDCKRKGQCSLCKQVIRICVLHARNCAVTNCKIYYCGTIRIRLSMRQEMLRNQKNGTVKTQDTTAQLGAIPLQRSTSVGAAAKSTVNRAMWVQVQRSNSFHSSDATTPENIGSGLLHAIGTQGDPRRELALRYEQMDITQQWKDSGIGWTFRLNASIMFVIQCEMVESNFVLIP